MIPYLTTELVILSVLFFFLLFFFMVDLVVSVLCAKATTPVSRERPSIKLMIFFICVILLGELLVEINYEPILAALHEDSLKRLLKSLYLEQASREPFTDSFKFSFGAEHLQNV